MPEIDTRRIIVNQIKCTVQVMLFLTDLVHRQGFMSELKFLGVVGNTCILPLGIVGKRTDTRSRPAWATW